MAEDNNNDPQTKPAPKAKAPKKQPRAKPAAPAAGAGALGETTATRAGVQPQKPAEQGGVQWHDQEWGTVGGGTAPAKPPAQPSNQFSGPDMGQSGPFTGPTQGRPQQMPGTRAPGRGKAIAGIVVLLIIIFGVYYLYGTGNLGIASGTPSDLSRVLSAQNFNASAVAQVVNSHTSAYQQFHANYTGTFSLSTSVLGLGLAFAGPIKVQYSKYGNDTRVDYNISTNSTYLHSLAGSTFLLNGSWYSCSTSTVSSFGGASTTSAEQCTTLSTSGTSLLDVLNQSVRSNLSLTNRSVTQTTINGYPCTMLRGRFVDKASINSSAGLSSTGLGELGGGGAEISGNIGVCFSNQYYEPVGIYVHVSNYSYSSGGLSASLALNATANLSATSMGPASSLQYIEAVPVTQSCDSLISIFGVNCTAPVIGTNGQLNLTLTQSADSLGTTTGYSNVKMACTTGTYVYPETVPSYEFQNVSASLPASVSTTLQCYNQNGQAITSLAPDSLFFATVWYNYTYPGQNTGFEPSAGDFATIEGRVATHAVAPAPHPVFSAEASSQGPASGTYVFRSTSATSPVSSYTPPPVNSTITLNLQTDNATVFYNGSTVNIHFNNVYTESGATSLLYTTGTQIGASHLASMSIMIYPSSPQQDIIFGGFDSPGMIYPIFVNYTAESASGSTVTTTVAPVSTSYPVTLSGGGGYANEVNGSSCNGYSVGGRNSHTGSGSCYWSGGDLELQCGLGIQDGAYYTVTGASDGKVYFDGSASSCSSLCSVSTYLPAQTYIVSVSGGLGSGYCSGSDYATLQSPT